MDNGDRSIRNARRGTCPGCGREIKAKDDAEAQARYLKHARSCVSARRLAIANARPTFGGRVVLLDDAAEAKADAP